MMSDNEKREDIRKILLSSLVIVFFVCIIITYYLSLYSQTRENIINIGRINAGDASSQINQHLSPSMDVIKLAAYTLDNMVCKGHPQDDILDYLTDETRAIEDSDLVSTTGLYGYINGEFLDGSGWVPDDTYNPTLRPWYVAARVGTGSIVTVDPYIDRETGTTMISLARTLGDSASVVALDISIDDLQNITEQHVSDGISYAEFIINGSNTIVAHSDRSLIGANIFDGPDPLTDAISRQIHKTENSFFYLEQGGRDYLVYFIPLENEWTFITVIDATDDFNALKFPLLATVLISILIVVIGTFFIIRSDRNARKTREAVLETERAKAANEAKSSFLSTMSHEIRTPINAILGMNEMILREGKDDAVRSYSDNIRNAGETLLGIINDVLDISRIEAGKLEIIPVDYDLASVINDLVNMIRVRTDAKGLALKLNVDRNIPNLLNGDEIRIKQIITNILANAVKYTEEGSITLGIGYRRIESEPDNMILDVSVKDTGIGIKEEDLERLFQKYERFEEERNRNVEGTGLGLNITMHLLEMMDSKLQVESVYGEGSDFSFALKQQVIDWSPMGDYETSLRSHMKEKSETRDTFTAPEARVLVIDDNPMNLVVFKSLVKRTKIHTDTAGDGDEGIRLSYKNKYDIIFIDHMMPGKDGIETLHAIKGVSGNINSDTVTVCLTANAVTGAREMYLNEGFDDYLTKPMHPNELEEMLRTYLEDAGDNRSDDRKTENPDKAVKTAAFGIPETIVYTNDNCIGCNKCIKVCSAIGACISSEENGKARIRVDSSKCVACGSCIDVCEHGAREFEDDTERFFRDLEKGENISLLLAPAFRANYPDEYESVLGGLKDMGVNRIISVSFGADITTWGYINYIKEHEFYGGISQPCPAVVSYIERYLPLLIPKLFPVQSPLMCAAIYARKEMGITDRFAFISPCIAKKLEIEDEHNAGLVQYNVTFEHLMRYVREHGIKGHNTHSEIEYGLGSFYPTPGGLAENVKWFLGDSVYIRQIEGERHLYEWMHNNEDRIRNDETPFAFIDALNCEKGCICGTAVDPERSRTDDALYALLDIRESSKKDESGSAWSRNDSCEERLKNYNRQFEGLDLNDYLRGYTDRSAGCKYDIPNDDELEAIYNSMNKFTTESRNINCTCCGYESCRQMATAIHNGFNHKENCIYYEKTMVQELELEQEVTRESMRTRDRILSKMSHEIRTPINAIQGMNEMITRESDDANILLYSGSIRTAVGTLLGFVNELLDLSEEASGDEKKETVWYESIPGIDGQTGLKNSATEETYRTLMKVFYESIGANRDEISGLYDAQDWRNYTVKVHALKSTALLIGAKDLAACALDLEMAGKRDDIAFIRENHSKCMELLTGFEEPLSKLFASEAESASTDGNVNEDFDRFLIESIYEALSKGAAANDDVMINNTFGEADEYTFSPADTANIEKLKELFDDRDYEKMISVIDGIR